MWGENTYWIHKEPHIWMAQVASATSGTKPKKHEDHLVDVCLALAGYVS